MFLGRVLEHRFSKIFSLGKKFRNTIAVDETVVKMYGLRAYVWSAVDVDSGEILAVYASRSRNMLIALKSLRCINKPLIVVDRGPWYRWALEKLGLKYQYQRFGLRNAVERFFGYLKQRTRRFYNNINTWSIKSIEDYSNNQKPNHSDKNPRRRITWLTRQSNNILILPCY
jgi:transposase-like protein